MIKNTRTHSQKLPNEVNLHTAVHFFVIFKLHIFEHNLIIFYTSRGLKTIYNLYTPGGQWLFPTLIDNLASEKQFSRSRNGLMSILLINLA